MSAKRFILQKTMPGSVERSRQIGRIVQELEALPCERSWLVTSGPYRKDRSLEQNAALYGVAYEALSEYTGHTAPELHDMFLRSYFGEFEKVDPWGKVIRRPRRTTTTDERGQRNLISTLDFMNFYSHIQQKAAEIGCDVPDPNPKWQQEKAA